MDETQQTKSEAAAVRRRRSSILKSQKATRTPFSELEFNVATPTDATKSRRVSFSRRTGVAEFVTNEATTTWKNFYEEHNKSLESSGNDSAAVASRQSVGHLGRRSYFDKQFQEDEALAVDTLNPRESNINISFNTTNFADQIAALENTGDGKNLSAPHNQFNLSSFTEHQTKLFEDNIGNPGFGEVTDKIDLNFSVNPIKINENDDLEEIQKDIQLQQASSNIICHGPMRDRKSVSEYIEIDELNMTRATANVEESDMSITDTIHSSKVQNVSKNTSIKNSSISGTKGTNPDWLADKENIVVNPYIAPRESVNFAVNEEADQVLVFDGKRLTVQSQNESLVSKTEPEVTEKKVPTRKTIVLNLHDDLPNFVDDLSISRQLANKFEKSDSKINMSDISFTQALPKVVLQDENKRKTIVFDDGDISVTQGISAKVILPEENTNKRQTIVFDDIGEDISMTQVHGNIISEIQAKSHNNHKNTVIYEDDANISMTQVLPSKIIDTQKRKTIIYDNDDGNISLTQIVKGNNILAQSEALEKEDIYDISMTQAVNNVILTQTSTKRTTIVFENDTNDISMTQALPSNVLLSMQNSNEKEFAEKSTRDEKSNTRIFHDDVSMTEIVPSDIAVSQTPKATNITSNIEYCLDISMTQALPVNILENKENKRKTVVFDDDDMGNISVTQAVPTNIIINQDANLNYDIIAKRKTIVFDDDCGNISITQAVPTNILCDTMNVSKHAPIDSKVIKNSELSKTQDVLDEINSIIDQQDKPMSLKDCFQDLDSNSIKIDSELASKTMASKTINMSKCEEVRKRIDSFNKDVLVYQAFFKHGKWHRKKSPVPPYTDDTDIQDAAVGCTSSEIIPAIDTSNTKTVLNELLSMSNASINIETENNTSIPLKKESSKKSVTYEDNIGVSQFQIDVALEEKKQLKVANENDQSVFQIDIPLENIDDLKPNTVMQLLPTGLTSVIETGNESPDEDAEVNNKAEIMKAAINNQSVTNIVENKIDLETQELPFEHKIDDTNKVQAEFEKSLAILNQIEPVIEKSLADENKMDVESEKKIENEIMLENNSEASGDVANESDDNKCELKKESFVHENLLDSDTDTTFAPSRRLSKIPSRQSLAPSRDEFLNDITLAQQMLQNTKFELENTSSMQDATVECTLDDEEDANPTKTDSPVVVKKLHFEDETLSDTSDQNISALKKSPYPETSQLLENKAMVIPPFLKDVSEDIKDLMKDLVKPMPDTMPFETNTDLLKRTSTCSMQIQASLIASSQIEIASNDSYNTLDATSTGRMKSVSFANESYSKAYESEIDNNIPSKPIVFDPNNPLNNVFIKPIGPSEVHSYNPLKSSEGLFENEESDVKNAIKDENKKPIVDNIVLISSPRPKRKLKNSEVNTTITVKENSELLIIHSSLTMIEDDHDSNSATSDLESKESSDTSLQSVAPFRKQHVNIEADSSSSGNKESTKSSSEVETDSNNSLKSVAPNKAQKRYYSPNKHECSTNSVDITPKPSSKLMRHSTSPTITLVDGSLTSMEFDLEFDGVWAKNNTNINNYQNLTHPAKTEKEKQVKKRIYSPQKRDNNTVNVETTPKPTSKLHKTSKSHPQTTKTSDVKHEKSTKKHSPNNLRLPTSKPGTKVTVQRALVSYDKPKKSSPIKNKMEYEPELNVTARNVARSIIQSTTIASKIERFPFMRDGECKWEACTRDAWVFSLLKGRVRLCVNFVRTKQHLVTDDTPVDSVTVHVNRVDINSPIASLCVGFAADTMTNVVNTKKNCTAVRVPQLLGRCAGVARLATQWARAMVDAKARLGFSLTEEGKLTFNVANLTVRSVHHLTMRISLTKTGGVPWPRASDVTVATLIGDDVTDHDIQTVAASAPCGWGHVPVTAWTIFRHLKNKKQNQLLDLV